MGVACDGNLAKNPSRLPGAGVRLPREWADDQVEDSRNVVEQPQAATSPAEGQPRRPARTLAEIAGRSPSARWADVDSDHDDDGDMPFPWSDHASAREEVSERKPQRPEKAQNSWGRSIGSQWVPARSDRWTNDSNLVWQAPVGRTAATAAGRSWRSGGVDAWSASGGDWASSADYASSAWSWQGRRNHRGASSSSTGTAEEAWTSDSTTASRGSVKPGWGFDKKRGSPNYHNLEKDHKGNGWEEEGSWRRAQEANWRRRDATGPRR